jgi:hypothetical protein
VRWDFRVLRLLLAYCTSPGWYVMVIVGRIWWNEDWQARESEVLGENLPQRHFCPSQNPTWLVLVLNPGRQRLTAWAMARPQETNREALMIWSFGSLRHMVTILNTKPQRTCVEEYFPLEIVTKKSRHGELVREFLVNLYVCINTAYKIQSTSVVLRH